MLLPDRRFGVLFVLFIAIAAAGESKALRQQAEELWAKAEAVSKLDPQKMSPYHEEATFTLYGLSTGDLKGKYHKEFADENDWVEEFRAGDYQQLSIHKAKDLYKHENSEFTPHSVELLATALASQKFGFLPHEKVHKIRQGKVGDVDASCIESEITDAGFPLKRLTCFSQADGTLLSEEFMQHTVLRSRYQPLDGKLLPTHVEVQQAGVKRADADLTYREDPGLSAAMIKVPAGMQPEHQCTQITPPKLQSRADPIIPDSYAGKPLHSTVTLEIVVGTDGRVKSSFVTETAGAELDHIAQQAVRQWRFKPSLCDGMPKQVKVQVEVNFRGM